MIRALTVMLALLLVCELGCVVCDGPQDYQYPAYGGTRDRLDRTTGRVGSIIDTAADQGLFQGTPQSAAEPVPEPPLSPWDPDDIDADEMRRFERPSASEFPPAESGRQLRGAESGLSEPPDLRDNVDPSLDTGPPIDDLLGPDTLPDLPDDQSPRLDDNLLPDDPVIDDNS